MEQKATIRKDSRYIQVMTIARRARQIMRESKSKGVNPWEVSLAKIGAHKPVKLAEEELRQNLLGFRLREGAKENFVEEYLSSPTGGPEAGAEIEADVEAGGEGREPEAENSEHEPE